MVPLCLDAEGGGGRLQTPGAHSPRSVSLHPVDARPSGDPERLTCAEPRRPAWGWFFSSVWLMPGRGRTALRCGRARRCLSTVRAHTGLPATGFRPATVTSPGSFLRLPLKISNVGRMVTKPREQGSRSQESSAAAARPWAAGLRGATPQPLGGAMATATRADQGNSQGREDLGGLRETHSFAPPPFNINASKRSRHSGASCRHGACAHEAGSPFFRRKNQVSESAAQVAETPRPAYARHPLPRSLPIWEGTETQFIRQLRGSEAVTCPLLPRGGGGGRAARGAGPAPGLPGLWSRRLPGPQGHHCHPSQDTPGRSQPEPTSHTPRPTLHGKFPARPRLQNPSLRGSRAPEGPKPQHRPG